MGSRLSIPLSCPHWDRLLSPVKLEVSFWRNCENSASKCLNCDTNCINFKLTNLMADKIVHLSCYKSRISFESNSWDRRYFRSHSTFRPSNEGLNESRCLWIHRLKYDQLELMRARRFAVP